MDFKVWCPLNCDCGRQFISTLWAEISRQLGIQLNCTTSYHPQANGMVERMRRQLKASLMATMNTEDWIDHLPFVFLGMRTALKEDIGGSSAEVVYGTTLCLPGQYFNSTSDDKLNHSDFTKKLKSSMNELRPHEPKHHLAKEKVFYIPDALQTCSHVYKNRRSSFPFTASI